MDLISSTLVAGAAIAATILVVVASTAAGIMAISRLLEPFTVLIIGDADKRTETPLSRSEKEYIREKRYMLKAMPTLAVLLPCLATTLAMAGQGDDYVGIWAINLALIQAWLQVVVAFGMLRLGLATLQGLFVR